LEQLQTHFKYLDEQVGAVEKDLTAQLADDDLGHD